MDNMQYTPNHRDPPNKRAFCRAYGDYMRNCTMDQLVVCARDVGITYQRLTKDQLAFRLASYHYLKGGSTGL